MNVSASVNASASVSAPQRTVCHRGRACRDRDLYASAIGDARLRRASANARVRHGNASASGHLLNGHASGLRDRVRGPRMSVQTN